MQSMPQPGRTIRWYLILRQRMPTKMLAVILFTNTTSKTEHATLDTPAKTLHKLSITTERSMLHWHVTAP